MENMSTVLKPDEISFGVLFLALQNSSIGDLVTHSLTNSLTDFYF